MGGRLRVTLEFAQLGYAVIDAGLCVGRLKPVLMDFGAQSQAIERLYFQYVAISKVHF